MVLHLIIEQLAGYSYCHTLSGQPQHALSRSGRWCDTAQAVLEQVAWDRHHAQSSAFDSRSSTPSVQLWQVLQHARASGGARA